MPHPQLAASLHVLLLSLVLIAPTAARGQETSAGPLEEAKACAQRNLPGKTVELRATFTKVDRVGGERESRARVIGKTLADGLRRVVLRFDKPIDVRGTAMLMIENPSGPSDFFVFSPDERRVRRVASRGSGGLFGTDFSYDDFENWRGFSRRGQLERLPDAVEAGRPAYVLSNKPMPEDGSSYERVTSFIDRETCVVLRIDSYEAGEKLRKVLRADPASIKTVGAVAVATAVVLEDVLDETRTRVKIEKVAFDVDIPDGRFRPTDLGD
jgi:hypothetical protein